MCNLSQGIEERGMQKAIFASIQNLTEALGLSSEEAMTILKIPESDRPKYHTLLKNQEPVNTAVLQRGVDHV